MVRCTKPPKNFFRQVRFLLDDLHGLYYKLIIAGLRRLEGLLQIGCFRRDRRANAYLSFFSSYMKMLPSFWVGGFIAYVVAEITLRYYIL